MSSSAHLPSFRPSARGRNSQLTVGPLQCDFHTVPRPEAPRKGASVYYAWRQVFGWHRPSSQSTKRCASPRREVLRESVSFGSRDGSPNDGAITDPVRPLTLHIAFPLSRAIGCLTVYAVCVSWRKMRAQDWMPVQWICRVLQHDLDCHLHIGAHREDILRPVAVRRGQGGRIGLGPVHLAHATGRAQSRKSPFRVAPPRISQSLPERARRRRPVPRRLSLSHAPPPDRRRSHPDWRAPHRVCRPRSSCHNPSRQRGRTNPSPRPYRARSGQSLSRTRHSRRE